MPACATGRSDRRPQACRNNDDLTGGTDDAGKKLREYLRQPRAAREHECVAGDLTAIAHAHRSDRTLYVRDGHARPEQAYASPREIRGQGADRTSRHDDAALRFEQRVADVVSPELRIPGPQGSAIEHGGRVAPPLQRPPRCLRVRIVAVRQPQHAALMEQRCVAAEAHGHLAPQLERARRELRVELIGSVPAADDARFVAGGRTGMTGAVSVDQGDSVSSGVKLMGGPDAEDARAYDNNVRHLTATRASRQALWHTRCSPASRWACPRRSARACPRHAAC